MSFTIKYCTHNIIVDTRKVIITVVCNIHQEIIKNRKEMSQHETNHPMCLGLFQFQTQSLDACVSDTDKSGKRTTSDGAVASDWLVLTLGLILTKASHGRLVLLAVRVVRDITYLMVDRTINPKLLNPHILVSYFLQTTYHSVDTRFDCCFHLRT